MHEITQIRSEESRDRRAMLHNLDKRKQSKTMHDATQIIYEKVVTEKMIYEKVVTK